MQQRPGQGQLLAHAPAPFSGRLLAAQGRSQMTMNTTLVINAKGGVGKSTITTNLASYFASRDITTTIADFDPQGSSLNWLAQRSSDARKIHGANLSSRIGTGLANGRRVIPRGTQQLIIDGGLRR